MRLGTGIEWREATWNPVPGCDRVRGALIAIGGLTSGFPLQGSFGGGRQRGCVEPPQCSRNRCLARWTVRIPHRGRGGGAGRATGRERPGHGPRSEVFVPFKLLKHPFRVPLLELASATMPRSQSDE
jgi:hypothetical protein